MRRGGFSGRYAGNKSNLLRTSSQHLYRFISSERLLFLIKVLTKTVSPLPQVFATNVIPSSHPFPSPIKRLHNWPHKVKSWKAVGRQLEGGERRPVHDQYITGDGVSLGVCKAPQPGAANDLSEATEDLRVAQAQPSHAQCQAPQRMSDHIHCGLIGYAHT